MSGVALQQRIVWLLDALKTGLSPSAAQVVENVAPSLLLGYGSPEAFAELLQTWSERVRVRGGERIDDQDHLATVELEAIGGGSIRMFCQVEPSSGRIALLRMRPGPGPKLIHGSFEELVDREPPGRRVSALADSMTLWLDREIDTARRDTPFVGFAAAVTHGRDVVYERTMGFADITSAQAVSGETVFSIGSISKVFTGIGVMRLCEQGRVGLHDDVNSHLRTLHVAAPTPDDPPVTVWHLLTHTGGVHHRSGEFAPLGETAPTLRDHYGATLECIFPAGSRGLYSNDGFAVLGQLIEDVAGEPLDTYMRREVFAPLGAETTSFLQTPAIRARLATAYEIVFGDVNELPQRDMILKPAGSVYSSLHDMVRLASMVSSGGMGEKSRVLQTATVQLMIQQHAEAEGSVFRQRGLAFGRLNINGHECACHNGGFPGFYAAFSVAADAGVGVVLMTNSSSGAPAALAQRLHERSLSELV